ncbi:hypothetical protein GGX14DRAFT_600708, partial [Mycena pura]
TEQHRLDNSPDTPPGETPSGGAVDRHTQIPPPKGMLDLGPLEVGPSFEHYHTTPFAYRWDPNYDPSDPDDLVDDSTQQLDEGGIPPLPPGHEEVFGEVYYSRKMRKMQAELPKPAPEAPKPYPETIIAAYMFWSDATCLAYLRGKPTARAGYHQAYFPKLPDWVKDRYSAHFHGRTIPADVLMHLKRDLIHGVWKMLLTPEFIDAYRHGIIITCFDKMKRLIFPRFMVYGADYPEKVLLSTIKNLGSCPCPRCFIKKEDIPKMGMKNDMKARRTKARKDVPFWRALVKAARKAIFKGCAITGTAVNKLLKAQSWTPTEASFLPSNAFCKIRDEADPTFNVFDLFVPDLLHEVELGVVKSLLIHTLRLLNAFGGGAIDEFDHRFREVPTFGRFKIRKFHSNVSEMKRLAGRDFEDTLQCILPVIEGLGPTACKKYEGILMDMWFMMCKWHGLAKLRMHTTTRAISSDNNGARRHQTDARKKRAAGTAALIVKLEKKLNLETIKFHSLGDYADMIENINTSDSTQNGELLHVDVKISYGRSNKRDADPQIAKMERRLRLLDRMDHRQTAANPENAPVAPTPPRDHHNISDSHKTAWQIGHFPTLEDVPNDVAYDNFVSKLKTHLLRRIEGRTYDGNDGAVQYTPVQLDDILIENRQKLYTHATMRVNYTTYDRQRDQDMVNLRTRSNVMVLSCDDPEVDPHPYWYAKVLQIFHADVRLRGYPPRRMEFLWVRWYTRDTDHRSGWDARRLHRFQFLPHTDPEAFGFLDPNDVVRGAHLIPAFYHGRTKELLPRSYARRPTEEDEDWTPSPFLPTTRRLVYLCLPHRPPNALTRHTRPPVAQYPLLAARAFVAQALTAIRCPLPTSCIIGKTTTGYPFPLLHKSEPIQGKAGSTRSARCFLTPPPAARARSCRVAAPDLRRPRCAGSAAQGRRSMPWPCAYQQRPLASTPPPAHANALAVLRPRRSTTRRQRCAGLGFFLTVCPRPSPTSPVPPSTPNMCMSTCAIPYHPSRADVLPPSKLPFSIGASPEVNWRRLPGATVAVLRCGITAPDEGHGEAEKPQHRTLLTVAGPPAHTRASEEDFFLDEDDVEADEQEPEGGDGDDDADAPLRGDDMELDAADVSRLALVFHPLPSSLRSFSPTPGNAISPASSSSAGTSCTPHPAALAPEHHGAYVEILNGLNFFPQAQPEPAQPRAQAPPPEEPRTTQLARSTRGKKAEKGRRLPRSGMSRISARAPSGAKWLVVPLTHTAISTTCPCTAPSRFGALRRTECEREAREEGIADWRALMEHLDPIAPVLKQIFIDSKVDDEPWEALISVLALAAKEARWHDTGKLKDRQILLVPDPTKHGIFSAAFHRTQQERPWPWAPGTTFHAHTVQTPVIGLEYDHYLKTL